MAKGKAVPLGQQSFMGQEIPGDDLTADFDPMTHEHAGTDLDDLDRLIEGEVVDMSRSEDEKMGLRPPPAEPDEPSEVEQAAAQEEVTEEETIEEPEEETAQEEEPQEAQAEESEEAAEVEEEAPVDERLSTLEREIERERIRSEKREAELDKWQLIAERESARAGNLQQQIRSDAQQPAAEYSDPVYDEPRQTPQAESPQAKSETQGLIEDLNIQAMQGEQVEFSKKALQFQESLKGQNGASEAFAKDIESGLLERRTQLEDAAVRGRPKAAARMARNIFNEVYADARLKQMDRQDQLAAQIKDKQKSSMRSKKRAASGSPGKSAGKAQAKPKYDPMTVPLDEYDDHLDRELGTNKDAGLEII